MAHKSKIEIPVEMLTAIYRKADVPEHEGNPLILALPPFQLADELINAFGRYPHIADSERALPIPMRMIAVSRLNNYLEPLTSHFDVVNQVGLIVRAGYVHRNPLDDNYRKALIRFYRDSMNGKICSIGLSTPSTAPSFAVFGVSGVGKSSVINRALTFLPQVLIHDTHQFAAQVVWLKVDCPMDGSLKQLLLSILEKFDELLGTEYRKSVSWRRANDDLIIAVAKIAAKHHLGLLVIDEIQNLLEASGVGQAKMLNFFVTFANEVKIPFITVGTLRAQALLEGTFREARRVGDHGACLWTAMVRGEEWKFFLEGLFKYQWTAHFVPLDPKISECIFELTQGIHALVVRLFQLTQLQAITDQTDIISEDLLKQVAAEKFKLVAPMLDALRKGDKKEIEKFEDLFYSGLNQLDQEVDNVAKLSLLKVNAESRNRDSAERVRAISALIAMGMAQELAQDAVTAEFDAQPELSSDAAVRQILNAIHDDTPKAADDSVVSLMAIVKETTAAGGRPLDALADNGLVAVPEGVN